MHGIEGKELLLVLNCLSMSRHEL